MRNHNLLGQFVFWGLASFVLYGCTGRVPVPPEYRSRAALAPVVIDCIVIKDYGGNHGVNIVDVIVQRVEKNKSGYVIPRIITVEYPSLEIHEMDLSAAEHAKLYIKPVISVGNPYRWIRLWQYPSRPKTDDEWNGLFQGGRWESTLTGPWPVPPRPLNGH